MSDKIAAKIAALLAKAESTNSEHERDTLLAKATELQFKYAIDEAMLRATSAASAQEIVMIKLCQEKNTPTIKAKRILADGLAKLNRCFSYLAGGRAYMAIHGTRSDTSFVEQMYVSLVLQMEHAMFHAESTRPAGEALGSWRISFAYGYVGRVLARLQEAQSRMEADVEPGALVLVRDQTDRIRDSLLGDGMKFRKGAGAKHRGSLAGSQAGRRAADSADLGGTRVGSSRALGIGA